MARRILTTAAAFTAGAALVLTACGDGDESPEKIEGADKGTSASPSADAPDSVKRPEVKLPKSFALDFRGWTSSDPIEQAVLNDGKEQVRAGYAAIIANDPGSTALAFYDTKTGLAQDREWIKTYTDKDLTVIGKAPVYNAKATVVGEKKRAASLSYCMDESKAYSKNRKTGKVEGTPAGTNSKVLYTTTLKQSEQGVWQTVSVDSKRGGCS
ncbi:hypothetical protein [Streptomyces sp. NPDC051776]|uniref:hypothetical protein n=1 Tax=Streptomyces sp. NPDC051776 TaxID=3155414 RepID=UPI0034400512